MRIEESEDRLQRDSKLYLDAVLPADAVWFHCPNGMSRTPSEAGRLKAHGVLAGVADWIVVYRGKTAFIELKTARGRLSPAQIAFAKRAEAAGAKYMVCRSLLEIELALAALEVETKGRLAA